MVVHHLSVFPSFSTAQVAVSDNIYGKVAACAADQEVVRRKCFFILRVAANMYQLPAIQHDSASTRTVSRVSLDRSCFATTTLRALFANWTKRSQAPPKWGVAEGYNSTEFPLGRVRLIPTFDSLRNFFVCADDVCAAV